MRIHCRTLSAVFGLCDWRSTWLSIVSWGKVSPIKDWWPKEREGRFLAPLEVHIAAAQPSHQGHFSMDFTPFASVFSPSNWHFWIDSPGFGDTLCVLSDCNELTRPTAPRNGAPPSPPSFFRWHLKGLLGRADPFSLYFFFISPLFIHAVTGTIRISPLLSVLTLLYFVTVPRMFFFNCAWLMWLDLWKCRVFTINFIPNWTTTQLRLMGCISPSASLRSRLWAENDSRPLTATCRSPMRKLKKVRHQLPVC